MKTIKKPKTSESHVLTCFIAISAFIGMIACTPEEIIPDPPSNVFEDKFLFCYHQNAMDWGYRSSQITGKMGSDLFTYSSTDNNSGYAESAGVEAGNRVFVLMHNRTGFTMDNKDWMIREIHSSGELAGETDGGSWEHNYESVFGFQVGSRGFVFGQDSYGDHRWFVQEITSEGKLADRESDSGTWNNFYPSATPLYINGKTYLFFQTESNGNYWFISSVTDDGRLTDVSDGYWDNFWETITSVSVGGLTYLVGIRDRHTMTDLGEWFIQQVTHDGRLGDETDRGTWDDFYNYATGYSIGSQSYLFAYRDQASSQGHWFIQEITSGGKMGLETSAGNLGYYYTFFHAFNQYGPAAFRYSIGWDLSATTGSPARAWSPMVSTPWSGATKLGGGAALGRIDQDDAGRYDIVMSGIQDMAGNDRFYYKVAWNLDPVNNGPPAAFGKTLYGPECGGNQAGGGTELADIDGNGVADLVLMSVDDPDGANSFWYTIGWNINRTGAVASWSAMTAVDGLDQYDSGGGVAIGDLDRNGRPDMVLVAIDNATGANTFRFKVGRNLDSSGKAASWTGMLSTPFTLGDLSAGGGAALADINGNGKPDIVLADIDSPAGANPFWYYIGWDIDINGQVSGWSPRLVGPSLGSMTSGGGAAMADIDKNGILDLLLMTVDNPYGKD